MRQNRNPVILKKSLNLAFLLAVVTSWGQGPIVSKNLERSKLPKSLKIEGKIVNAVTWTDKSGENMVITSETGIKSSKSSTGEENRNAALYAYHFSGVDNLAKQTWKASDFVKDCPLDLEATFIKNTFKITDLNNDGVAEIWLMYKTVCHGDVSPYEMKIIMYQGPQKFAIRGHNKVKVSEKEYAGGEYKVDKAFSEGPAVFREFAVKMWNKNIMQEW